MWSRGEPHFPSQQELDDVVRDLNLPKPGAELLASRLREWNLLDLEVKFQSTANDIEPSPNSFPWQSHSASVQTLWGCLKQ